MKCNTKIRVQHPDRECGRWPAAVLVLGGLLLFSFPAVASDRIGRTNLEDMSIHGATVGMTEAEALAKWQEAGFTKDRKNLSRQRPDGRDIITYETVVPWEKAKNGPAEEDIRKKLAECDSLHPSQQKWCQDRIKEGIKRDPDMAFPPSSRLVSRIEYRQMFNSNTPVESEEVIKKLEGRFGDVVDAGGVLVYVDDSRTEKAADAIAEKCVQRDRNAMKSLLSQQDSMKVQESRLSACYPDSLSDRLDAARYLGARNLTIRVCPNRSNRIDMDFRWPYVEGERSVKEAWAKSHGQVKEKNTAKMSF